MQQKVILSNYHTHTRFCDGSAEPEAYVKEAIKNNFFALGFSAHAPLHFENPWSLAMADTEIYCTEISRLREKYKNEIEIYLSMEMDFIPGTTPPFQEMSNRYQFDYVLGSVHLVKNPQGDDLWFIDGPVGNFDNGLSLIFNNDIQYAVTTYFNQIEQMLASEKMDVIAHFDKIKMNNKDRFFKESESWYKQCIQRVLEKISSTGVIVEVNTRGIYTGRCPSFYPGEEVLKLCYEMQIPITISADAHKPHELKSSFDVAEKCLKQIGFKFIKVLLGGRWVDYEIGC